MNLNPYRRVLALPGVRTLVLLALVARIPATAIGITLMLHTVNKLDRSYGEAGLVTAVFTIGAALGSPLWGRLIDRKGLRLTLAITTAMQVLVWTVAPDLGYSGLLMLSGPAGLFGVPIFTIVRQSLAAMVPEEQRRPAFALDSVGTELSFMVGPALAVVAATSFDSRATMYALGAAVVSAGLGMFMLNPPVRGVGETPVGGPAPGMRTWLRPPVVAVLIMAIAMTFVLSATELATVATLREADATSWTGLVIGLWCFYSLVGGLIFGAMRRSVSAMSIVAAMALLTIPIGLAPTWQWVCVALIPAGALCAPSIASGNEALSRLVPAESRGEAMGVWGSAMTTGVSMGAPFAGFIVDRFGSGWAFAACGLLSLLLVLAVLPAYRRMGRALLPSATSG